MPKKEIKIADNLPYIASITDAVFITGTNKTLTSKLNEIDNSINNPLYGKKILCIGDSLTVGQGSTYPWCNIIADRNNMTLYKKGVSGQNIAGISSRCASLTEEADIAIFWGGTNDQNTSNYGAMADRDNTTFYGALHLGLSELQKRYEKVFVVNIWNFKKSNANIIRLNEIIKEVASYYSIKVIDVFSDLGIHNDTVQVPRMSELHDGLHFNEKGSYILADLIEKEIK